MRTLDAVLAELGGPADVRLVKIDVEGYESQVLKGMPRTLEQRPLVVFEALDAPSLEAARDALPAGYGILWSAGPDGKDDGGLRNGRRGASFRPGEDWIVLVPPTSPRPSDIRPDPER